MQSRVAVGAAQQTPQAALERYARLYVNWTADRVAGIQRELASLSTGQARAQALAGRRQLHARPDTHPKQRREQRPPRRHHAERHDARAVGPRDLRADERHRRLRGPPADAARHLRASHADRVGLGGKRMGTAELTCRSTHASVQKMDARLRCPAATHALRLALVYALLWTITLLGALLGTAFPGLAPGGRPHPALQESWGELASIAADNARVLSAPFLLAFFRFPAHPRTRQFGDLLIAGVLGANALRVGLALGRWHTRLIPYVPQLPLEWLAAALAGAAWLALRTGARRQTAIAYLAAVLVVVTAAAAVETIATPHAHARTLNVELGSTTAALHSAVPIPARRAGGGLPSLGSCAGAGNRFKVASLPSPRCRSVPLSRLAGAAGLRQPPPDPAKEGPP